MKDQKKGFSLTELMIVIGIAAILMSIAVPTFLGARNRSNASACRANMQIIKSAIKEWALDNPSVAVTNYTVKVSDITSYIDSGFLSLDDPVDGRYSQGQGADATWDTNDDIVVTIGAGNSIPNPTCSKAGSYSGHTL